MGRGKPATPINKEAFFKAVEEAEKDGDNKHCFSKKTCQNFGRKKRTEKRR